MYFLFYLPIYKWEAEWMCFRLVDSCCQTSAVMACSEHGHSLGLLFHSQQRDLPRDFHARLSRTGRIHLSFFLVQFAQSCLPRILNQSPRVRHGCTIALLLGCGCEPRLQEARISGTSADSILWVRYSTMDNIDGKQARRTGQSSGLGELFEYDTSSSTSTKT